MRSIKAFAFLLMGVVVVFGGARAHGDDAAEPRFKPDWRSLEARNPAPDWFRDAKFGIYCHWGVYCVPEYGSEWYPRNMHIKHQLDHLHHTRVYGDPSEFGYHDFVPMFKGEKFDPEEWATLFEKAGARFAGPVGEHHDGFAMWNTELTPWNAMDMGPKRDVVGELADAIRAHGMRFVTTFHHARNNQHQVEEDGKLVWTGHYPRVDGWPTVSEDPLLRILYGNIPRDQFLEMWKGKLIEVIDRYEPDMIWFDLWLYEIPERYQMEFLAHYFNKADGLGKEVVVTCKNLNLPRSISVEDFEKGRTDKLTEYAWLTDDTVSTGSWSYTKTLKIKSANEVLHVLIDIVSKNGQLLLNISPRADGSIPEDQKEVLLSMGDWLGRFGEAIYDTRPFLVYGQGPTQMEKGGHMVKMKEGYTPEDIRFTRKGDVVYAIALGRPEARKRIVLEAFGSKGAASSIDVTSVSVLGVDKKVKWKRTGEGLATTCPRVEADEMAVVFKLETKGLPPAE